MKFFFVRITDLNSTEHLNIIIKYRKQRQSILKQRLQNLLTTRQILHTINTSIINQSIPLNIIILQILPKRKLLSNKILYKLPCHSLQQHRMTIISHSQILSQFSEPLKPFHPQPSTQLILMDLVIEFLCYIVFFLYQCINRLY